MIFWLLLILPICCLGFGTKQPVSKPTVYTIEESADPNILTIHIDREGNSSATQLLLKGVSMGVAQQIKGLVCDNKPLKEDKPGTWFIPEHCQKIQWQVPLIKAGTAIASAQQSTKLGNFILLSESSSLPRLQDSSVPDILKIAIPNVKNIYPPINTAGELRLPSIQAAPLFVLLNPTLVGTISSGVIKLTYYLDNPASFSALPKMAAHMQGLEWLNNIFKQSAKEDFTTAWLGITATKISLSGATGSQLLLTNYPNDGSLPFGKAMLLYVALHEAFHQFEMHYPNQPTWISESLASYYGIRALQNALPDDPNTVALIDRFLASANHFQNGLLVINRKVEAGDRSEYGAFYAKGIAFWMAVEKDLQQTRKDSLDNHLIALLQAKNDSDTQLTDLQKILALPPERWSSLRSRFLD